MRAEPLAAEVGFGELAPLHHRAHGAIKDQDAFGEQAFKRIECRHRVFFGGLVPTARITVNGSLVRRAPSATRTSLNPARVSSPAR